MNRYRNRVITLAAWMPFVWTWLMLASLGCWQPLLAESTRPAIDRESASKQKLEFNRDIRPILSDACFHCHGPDSAQRQGELRLDQETGLYGDREGHRLVVPGDLVGSVLWQRLTAAHVDERMPPARSGRSVTNEQRQRIKEWIVQGAPWQPHWAFVPPRRPDLPMVKNKKWARQPLDAFVLARLEKENLAPSPEADRVTWLRRVTLDLTGLPPTREEWKTFLSDTSPRAYEKVVDRLLASPRYGERMAWRWLEAARYADTNGYQSDGEREMWRWRDWVIDAYNQNMPFDQFTLEQMAGDLLPSPTLEQRLATGFHRNHRGNAEGGIIPEEYAVEYVADRVETTATVWLGLTLGCARCHDHKYDPFSQRDYYQLFAFFHNIPEKGRAVKYGNSPPLMPVPTRTQQQTLSRWEEKLQSAQNRLEKLAPQRQVARAAWEESARAHLGVGTKGATSTKSGAVALPDDGWSISADLVYHQDCAHLPLPLAENDAAKKNRRGPVGRDGCPAPVSAPRGAGWALDGRCHVDAGDVAPLGFYDKFTLSLWARSSADGGGTLLSRMVDVPDGEGYALRWHQGILQLNLVKRWLDDALRVETAQPLPRDRWCHVAVCYDGSRVASGVRFYVDGQPMAARILLDELNQTFQTTAPLRLGGGNGPGGRFRGDLADARIYGRVLEPDEIAVLACPTPLRKVLALAPEQRGAVQRAALEHYFALVAAPQVVREALAQVRDLRRQRQQTIESFPTAMVLEEMPVPRATHVLRRGQYDQPGERVFPNVPASLPDMKSTWPRNRLGLAQWLIQPNHPLTARVAVNRAWQLHFGRGLVGTGDDFGSQGEAPTHPELLDWLATEFIRTGWNGKALHEMLVLSATYRQSARISPELARRDPENLLLGRGPRIRLGADMLRDQALAVSGLLVEHVGGPSVKIYQPPGLWQELTGTDYIQDHGQDLYRRSLYTYWKRTIAPPGMVAFDASSREFCVVRETRTNTPLQALTLLNDVVFVEAARLLAERIVRAPMPAPVAPAQPGSKHRERLRWAFETVVARSPSPRELLHLEISWQRYYQHFHQHRDAALALLSNGEHPRDPALDVCEVAAYTLIGNLLLNLDEVLNKG